MPEHDAECWRRLYVGTGTKYFLYVLLKRPSWAPLPQNRTFICKQSEPKSPLSAGPRTRQQSLRPRTITDHSFETKDQDLDIQDQDPEYICLCVESGWSFAMHRLSRLLVILTAVPRWISTSRLPKVATWQCRTPFMHVNGMLTVYNRRQLREFVETIYNTCKNIGNVYLLLRQTVKSNLKLN